MASKQIVTCDGCEREESSYLPTWWKVNVPRGFLTGDLSEKAPAEGDLCPQCLKRAALVFSGYRKAAFRKAERADAKPALIVTKQEPPPQPASEQQIADRAKWGTRMRLIIDAMRAGATTDTDIAHRANATMHHVRWVLRRLMQRGQVTCRTDMTPWQWSLVAGTNPGPRANVRGGRRGSRRRGAPALVTKSPGISKRVRELLTTGPASLEDLAKALAPAHIRSIRTAVQNLLRDRAIVTVAGTDLLSLGVEGES